VAEVITLLEVLTTYSFEMVLIEVTADCRYGRVAQNLEIICKTFQGTRILPWDLRLVPLYNMLLRINRMRILVRVVLN